MREHSKVEVPVTLTNDWTGDVDLIFQTMGQNNFLVLSDGQMGNASWPLDVRIRKGESLTVIVRVVAVWQGEIGRTLEVTWKKRVDSGVEYITKPLLDISATVVENPPPTAPVISVDFEEIWHGDDLWDVIAHVSWGASTDPEMPGSVEGIHVDEHPGDGVKHYELGWGYLPFTGSVSECSEVPTLDFNDPYWNQKTGEIGIFTTHVDGITSYSLRPLSAYNDGLVEPGEHVFWVGIYAWDWGHKTSYSQRIVCFEDLIPPVQEPEPVFPDRGDVDTDGKVILTDGIYLLNHLYSGGPAPVCAAAGDVDADGSLLITDGIYLFNFLFSSGPAPSGEEITSCEL